MIKNIIEKYRNYNDNKIVCRCFEVKRLDIENAVREGATTLKEVRNKTKAGMGCGKCNKDIEKVIKRTIKSNK